MTRQALLDRVRHLLRALGWEERKEKAWQSAQK